MPKPHLLQPLLGLVAGGGPRREPVTAPLDPASLGVPLDAPLMELRAGLLAHRRRLWLRRAVRRAWIVLAAVAVSMLVVAVAQRAFPLEGAPLVSLAVPVVGALALLVLVVRARPSLGETALAVDAEGGTGDRVATALAFAGSPPAGAAPDPVADADADDTILAGRGFDLAAAESRFVRRQRRDAVARLRAVEPWLFRPRVARRPALVAIVAAALLAPALLLPNPQDARIAQDRQVREEAQRQAQHIDDVAKDLEARGADANDPRTRLAEELRRLAERLRTNPGDLDLNLAQLGSVEDEVRAQLDPANEQKAASLAALSRALSRAAAGNPQANAGGDPGQTRADLAELGANLDTMTKAERDALAQRLAKLQGQASQADGAAGQALRDAAASLAQGDTAGARAALDRLGEALNAAGTRVQVNRDLSTAASNLQDARRNLANAGGQGNQAGQQGTGQQGTGQPGQSPGQSPGSGQGAGQGSGQPGQSPGSGQGAGQGSGQPGQSPGSGQGAGQGSGQPGQSPGSGQGSGQGQGQGAGQGQGQGQGQGSGSGQGQGQGGGSLGGGGSNASHLGTGISSGRAGGPVNPNRPSVLGPDLGSVFAPFDRLGKPGDPSYVAGTGGDGQTQQGNQQGPGSNNGSYVPYQQVYGDFHQYALTTLDRSYVPLSVKDYVRDYFSSLDPSR